MYVGRAYIGPNGLGRAYASKAVADLRDAFKRRKRTKVYLFVADALLNSRDTLFIVHAKQRSGAGSLLSHAIRMKNSVNRVLCYHSSNP